MITKFKQCTKEFNLEMKKFLCGDCTTRWKFTYELLKTVFDLRKMFVKYEIQGKMFCFYGKLSNLTVFCGFF